MTKKRGWFSLPARAAGVLIVLLCLLVLIGCVKPSVATADAFLEFAREPTPIALAAEAPAAFDETACWVLRCLSLSERASGLSARVTKAKSAAIEALIFVNLDQAPSDATTVAYIRLGSGEAEYDLSTASYRTVKVASASEAVAGSGITYDDWQMGIQGGGEAFPCCQ